MNRSILAALVVLLAGCNPDYGLGTQSLNEIAVTAGDFDDLSEPLERMDVAHETYEGIISTPTWDRDWDHEAAALKVEGLFADNADELFLYDALFLSSGTRGLGVREYNGLDPDDHLVSDPAVVDAMRDFVSGGHTLLATDWSYDLVEAAFPDRITFLNDDTVLDAAQRGEIGETVADVTHEALVEALDSETMSIRFDFGNWAVMESVSDDVDVLLRGDVRYVVREEDEQGEEVETFVDLEDVPLMVAFSEGSGRVVYTSFHVDAQNDHAIDSVLLAAVGEFDRGSEGRVNVDE